MHHSNKNKKLRRPIKTAHQLERRFVLWLIRYLAIQCENNKKVREFVSGWIHFLKVHKYQKPLPKYLLKGLSPEELTMIKTATWNSKVKSKKRQK